MCGRYTQTADMKTLQERFRLSAGRAGLEPRYNIAPTQQAPVVVREAERSLEFFHWGLVPSWAKGPKIGHKMINARAESLLEKPSFRKPLQRSRCLVPADGFYEWKKASGWKAKTPVRVVLKGREPFAMAGLWDVWKAPDGTELRSFAIVTTGANDAMKAVHDRMPAILDPQDEERWLDPEVGAEKAAGLLRPWPGALELYEVSPLVNSPANDVPACAEELVR